jgi:hypothetical protein
MFKNPTKSATKPAARKSRKLVAFTTATIISFSLTLLAAGIAVLTGMVPLHGFHQVDRIDVGSLLFMMPVLALVLGVCFEVARIAMQSAELPEPRRRQTVRWSPGNREG